MKNKLLKKIYKSRILKRIYLERLGEPFIYNLFSLFYLLFGDLRKKIDYDLVPRQPYAFGLNEAFANAKKEGAREIVIIEFGVAAGAGLFNLAFLAERLSKIYKVNYIVIGFDTGTGMPQPQDYRDHPEKYYTGDFPPDNLTLSRLPKNTEVIYGEISSSLEKIKGKLDYNRKLGFVSVDVDYYSSTLDCLKVFELEADCYLSKVTVYFDDVNNIDHNEFCGELLAIKEFNQLDIPRKLTKYNQLKNWRIFKNALWLDQMYFCHIFDSDLRSRIQNREARVVLGNPYLD